MRATLSSEQSMDLVLWRLSGPSTALLAAPWPYALPQSKFCLWWIAAGEDGSARNEGLVFSEVEVFRYTKCYTDEIRRRTYDTLIDMGHTPLLDEIGLKRPSTRKLDLKHFAVSFDNRPLYEFAAQSFEFTSPFDVPTFIERPIKFRLESSGRGTP